MCARRCLGLHLLTQSDRQPLTKFSEDCAPSRQSLHSNNSSSRSALREPTFQPRKPFALNRYASQSETQHLSSSNPGVPLLCSARLHQGEALGGDLLQELGLTPHTWMARLLQLLKPQNNLLLFLNKKVNSPKSRFLYSGGLKCL